MSARAMLERLRKHLGARSDADLARRIGLPASEVCRIHTGQREDGMRLSTLKTISESTGVRIGELAEWWSGNESPTDTELLALVDRLQFMVDITAARVRVLDVNLELTEIPFAPGDDRLAVIRMAITERAAAWSST